MSGLSGPLGHNGTATFTGTLGLYVIWRTNAMISFSSGLWPNGMLGLKARIGLNGSVFRLSVDIVSGLTRGTASRLGASGALRLLPRDFPVLFGPFGTLGPDGSLDTLTDFLRQHRRRGC
jgi:hypothetical protein